MSFSAKQKRKIEKNRNSVGLVLGGRGNGVAWLVSALDMREKKGGGGWRW